MTTLADVVEAFRQLSENENETMFAQGILMLKAVEAGFDAADVKRECGNATGKAARTLDNRLRVAQVFGGDIETNYARDKDWSLHMLCATAPGVKPSDPETYRIAHQWLAVATDGYVDENGDTRYHTTRTLRKLMHPATDAPQPKPQSFTVTASIANVTALHHEILLTIFEEYDDVLKMPLEGVFQVTFTPQLEAA